MNRYVCPLKGQGLLSVWRFNLLIGICSLLLGACSNENKRQEPTDFIEIDMVPLIEGEAKKMPLQEWAKSVRFIPLETNEDILIASIGNVFQRGDTLLVYHSERLSLFNKEGKYLSDIGSKGQGPEEFTRIRDVLVHDNLIYVQEMGYRFKVYDWDGNFVKKLVLPHKVCGLITYPGKEEMLAYVNNRTGDESVRFYVMKDEQILDSVPNPFIYKRGPGAITLIQIPEFYSSRGSLNAFTEANSDTVYRVDAHLQTHPYVVFNMGKYLYTRQERFNTTAGDMMGTTFSHKHELFVVGEIGDNIFIRKGAGKLQNDRTYHYNKQTKEVHKLFLTYPEEGLDFLQGASFVPRTREGSDFFEEASFVPRTILDDKYLVSWEQPDNDENPVLVLVEP